MLLLFGFASGGTAAAAAPCNSTGGWHCAACFHAGSCGSVQQAGNSGHHSQVYTCCLAACCLFLLLWPTHPHMPCQARCQSGRVPPVLLRSHCVLLRCPPAALEKERVHWIIQCQSSVPVKRGAAGCCHPCRSAVPDDVVTGCLCTYSCTV